MFDIPDYTSRSNSLFIDLSTVISISKLTSYPVVSVVVVSGKAK